MNKSSIFESFNARNLNATQVAQTFIPPPCFARLTDRCHSLVIGPRGSGKTTLLKMLQRKALDSWKHELADPIKQKIDFNSIYISADISWGAQIKSIGHGNLVPEIQNKFEVSAFTSHVLKSIVDAFIYIVRKLGSTYHLTREQESELVRSLADSWKCNVYMFNLESLADALTERLSLIEQFANRISFLSYENQKLEIAANDHLHLEFLTSTILAIQKINSMAGLPDGKWALLFDEIEIAPKSIREKIISAMRSVDQRLIIKISISPYSEDVSLLESAISAMDGQDYFPIRLWFPKKEDGYAFCKELVNSMLIDYNSAPVDDPNDIFGMSDFDSTRDSAGYGPGSKNHEIYRALYESDPSFADYLDGKEVNINEMHLLSENDRASKVRNVRAVVTVRSELKSRSRKNPTLYAGSASLFAMVEGNPRLLISIVSKILPLYIENKRKIAKVKQSAEIRAATSRFRALLKTVPCESSSFYKANRGLLGFLDDIGEYFKNQICGERFIVEPANTFIVDSNCSNELLVAIGRALNAGALIYIPDEESETTLSSLKGKRFRLSYLLGQHYNLALTISGQVSLSKLLGSSIRNDDLFASLSQR